jgi:hypothetical protein
MLINSEYDEVGLEGIGISCLKSSKTGKTLANCNATELEYIEAYRSQFLSFTADFMQFSKNSVWSISCSSHSFACYGNRYNVPEIKVPGGSGLTPK